MKHPDEDPTQRETCWASYRAAGHDARRHDRFAEAEQQFRDALQVAEQFGPDDPRVADTLTDLALLLAGPGRPLDGESDAEPLLRRALAIREQVFGPHHPDVAQTLVQLAGLRSRSAPYHRPDPASALPSLERALAIHERDAAPDPMQVHSTINQLERLCHGPHAALEVEPLLRRAIALCERHWGAEHPGLRQSTAAIARLYEQQGRLDEAEALLSDMLAHHEATFDPEHPAVGSVLSRLVQFYVRQRRYAEAEALQWRQLPIQEKEARRGNPPRTDHLLLLADLCALQGKTAEAEALLQQTLARLEGTGEDRAWERQQALEQYAYLLRENDRFGEALELAARAQALRPHDGDPSSGARRRVVWPPPHPDEQPDFVWVRWLLVSYVTDRGAAVRWQTTADAESASAHRTQHGGSGGSGGGRGREFTHPLQFHHPMPSVQFDAFAGSSAGVDVAMATLAPSTPSSVAGPPRLVITHTVRRLGRPDFVEVEARFTNEGAGDLLRLRLDVVEPAPGWEFLPGQEPAETVPLPLHVGQIGPGGAGLLLVRLVRRSGAAEPGITLLGSYTDTAGTAFSL